MARAAVVFVVLCGILIASALATPSHEELFRDFMTTYRKSYSAEEFGERFRIFTANIQRIEALNAAQKSARFGVTRFADLTPKEFRAIYLNGALKSNQANVHPVSIKLDRTTALPDSFDWRDKGAVTPTKDQGQCGSCWAFSATEAIESQWYLAGHSLPVLAPQQIVDCDKGNGDQGCSGGDTTTAYEYVIKAGGLDTEASYPYTGADGNCAFKPNDVAAKISNWTYITTTKNETEMQLGLYTRGPLSICVEADTWQFYLGGVITSFCGENLDHCVMITGFSIQQGWDKQNYNVWNIRNSWGAWWGYGGYLYVERGHNLCGVADEVTIPLV